MISFAGGLPSPESFPVLDAGTIPPRYLQYGASEGEPELRRQIAAELRMAGLDCEPGQVLVLSGSQQGIDLVAKLMVDPGTGVALENPAYLAALQVFRLFGACFITLDPSEPAAMLSAARAPALCYTIPTFQNPTGRCYSDAERSALARTCRDGDVLLFEDDPYRDLVYDACERRPVCGYMHGGSWIYQGSFSKSLAPGLRLGYLAASPDLVPYLTRLKQAADLHSNRLSQYLVLQQLTAPSREERTANLRAAYRRKRDVFEGLLSVLLAEHADWQTPPGGLFFWLRLKRKTDTNALLQRAIAAGVAFMPGEPFFHTPDAAYSYLRLNFSHADEAAMEKGLTILRELLASR